MKDKIDYQKLYEADLFAKYDKHLRVLEKNLMDKSGISKQNKLSHFRDAVSAEIRQLTKKDSPDGSFKEDRYIYSLYSKFNQRKSDYEGDYIKYFLTYGLKDLKKEFKNRPTDIVFKNVLAFDDIDTLKFLAKYFALNKLMHDTEGIYPIETDSVADVMSWIREGKRVKIDPNADNLELFAPGFLKLHEDVVVKTVFTTRRQVLSMLYIFKVLDVEGGEKTEQARFIQFLTGKEVNAKSIRNTNIYKQLCSPLPLNDQQLLIDLQFVRGYFEKMGLNAAVSLINKEISKQK